MADCRHVWSVLCEKVIVDAESNNMSLDCLEQLGIVELPSDLPRDAKIQCKMELVSLWCRPVGELAVVYRARVLIKAPGGDQVGEALMDLTFKAGTLRLRTRLLIGA